MKFGGLKFLEAAHVKDLLSILRWAQNPGDRLAGFRTLQLMPGVEPATAARIMDGARLLGGREGLLTAPAPEGAEPYWDELVALCGGAPVPWPAELERAVQWYLPLLEEAYDDARTRTADLRQLELVGASYPSREAFLVDLVLDPPSATSAEAGVPHKDDDYLTLSTIHSAKGQEWKSVYLLNAVDGCMPADLATGSAGEIEEERRLLYVAMTRAKDSLDIITPQRFYVQAQSRQGDKAVFASRTRFIPDSLTGHFARISWPPSTPGSSATSKAPLAAVDLKARARNRWS